MTGKGFGICRHVAPAGEVMAVSLSLVVASRFLGSMIGRISNRIVVQECLDRAAFENLARRFGFRFIAAYFSWFARTA